MITGPELQARLLALADRLETEADYTGQHYIQVSVVAQRIRRALQPPESGNRGAYLRPGERRSNQPNRDPAQGQP